MAKQNRKKRSTNRRVSPSEMRRQYSDGQNTMRRSQNPIPPRQVPFDQQTTPIPRKMPANGEMQQMVLPMGKPQNQNEMREPRSSESHKKKKSTVRPQPPRRLTHGELRRRRRRRNLLMTLLVLVFIGIGVALSLTVLFKVEKFQIENLDKSVPADTGIYTEDAILAALGIPVGENMFQFSLREKEKVMLTGLPYLETIEIRRKLPSTLVIRVKPAVETWAAKSDSGWLTLSDGLKVMKIGEEQPTHLPALTGLSVHAPVAGYPLELIGEMPSLQWDSTADSKDMTPEQLAEMQQKMQKYAKKEGENDLNDLRFLISILEQYELKQDCGQIEMSNKNEIYFIYQGRAKVLLGTLNQLDYKLKFASYLLKNADGKGIGSGEKGILDVSHQLEDGSLRPTWSPGDFYEQTPPENTEENSAESQTEETTEQSTSDTDPSQQEGEDTQVSQNSNEQQPPTAA